MKIVVISDTHCQEELLDLPEGDILIHAGDVGIYDLADLEYINRWFGRQKFTYNIVIAGNHDTYLERLSKIEIKEKLYNAIYLQDEGIEIAGIKFWGSPFTPFFNNWAFMENETQLEKRWEQIPEDTDIIITHGPPRGILDWSNYGKEHCGSISLKERIDVIKLKYSIFGHIHNNYGCYEANGIKYINASILNDNYQLVNKPIVLEI